MTGITPAPLRALRRRVAVLVGEVLSPGVLVTVALPLVGWTGTRSLTGVGWGSCCPLLRVVPIVLFLGVRRGYWQDHHLRPPAAHGAVPHRHRLCPHRLRRTAPGRPRIVLALVVAILAGLVSTSVVNRRWKISVHTTSAAGVATASRSPGLMGRAARGRARRLVAAELDHHTVARRCGRTPRGGGVRHSLRAPALTTKSRSAPVPRIKGAAAPRSR